MGMKKIRILFIILIYISLYLFVGDMFIKYLLPMIPSLFLVILSSFLVPTIFILPVLFYNKSIIKLKKLRINYLFFSILVIVIYYSFYLLIYYKLNKFSSFEFNSISRIFNISFVFTILFSSIVEEIIYRGVVIGFLVKHQFNNSLIVLISSLFFGLAHYNLELIGIFNAFCLGIIFSITYLKYKNLVYCIFQHLIFNFLTGLIILH